MKEYLPSDQWNTLSDSQQHIVSKLIDLKCYQEQTKNFDMTFDALACDYFDVGWRGGYDPTPSFRSAKYISAHSTHCHGHQNPFLHYLFEEVGEAKLSQAFGSLTGSEIARIRAEFVDEWYLGRYPDVKASGADAFIHYMVDGWIDGRDSLS